MDIFTTHIYLRNCIHSFQVLFKFSVDTTACWILQKFFKYFRIIILKSRSPLLYFIDDRFSRCFDEYFLRKVTNTCTYSLRGVCITENGPLAPKHLLNAKPPFSMSFSWWRSAFNEVNDWAQYYKRGRTFKFLRALMTWHHPNYCSVSSSSLIWITPFVFLFLALMLT